MSQAKPTAHESDPKSRFSVFTPREVLVVKLDKDGRLAVSAELKPRSDPTRGNRDATMSDPDGEERDYEVIG